MLIFERSRANNEVKGATIGGNGKHVDELGEEQIELFFKVSLFHISFQISISIIDTNPSTP